MRLIENNYHTYQFCTIQCPRNISQLEGQKILNPHHLNPSIVDLLCITMINSKWVWFNMRRGSDFDYNKPLPPFFPCKNGF